MVIDYFFNLSNIWVKAFKANVPSLVHVCLCACVFVCMSFGLSQEIVRLVMGILAPQRQINSNNSLVMTVIIVSAQFEPTCPYSAGGITPL